MYKYWDASPNVVILIATMKADGFVYKNEGNDISYATDVTPDPQITHYRKWGNCYAYATYFKAYLDYKGEKSKIYLLRNGWLWHYILLWGNYSISNLEISYKTLDDYYNEGWEYQKEVYR